MASTLSDEYIAILRENALLAEPYPDDDPLMDCFDDDVNSPIWRRQLATDARRILREHGIELEEK